MKTNKSWHLYLQRSAHTDLNGDAVAKFEMGQRCRKGQFWMQKITKEQRMNIKI